MWNAPLPIRDKTQRWRLLRALLLTAMALVVGILAGCGGVHEPMDVPQDVAVPASTPTGTPAATLVNPTPTPNAKELAELYVQETRVAVRTALAGTPTWTPGAAPPGPSATPWLGLYPGCPSTSALDPYMVSCWAGVYNGKIVGVGSGREGRAGDMTQGLVWVYDTEARTSQFIPTPDKVGAVQIVAINGTLFTLSTVEHTPPIIYTFDLATRQWVQSPLTPVPTLTLSP